MYAKNYSLADYWAGLLKYCEKHPHWRYGQCAFNYLSQVNPNLGEKVRSSPVDPFYVDHNHPTLTKFSDFLKENW